MFVISDLITYILQYSQLPCKICPCIDLLDIKRLYFVLVYIEACITAYFLLEYMYIPHDLLGVKCLLRPTTWCKMSLTTYYLV